jgi:hypothetical protein
MPRRKKEKNILKKIMSISGILGLITFCKSSFESPANGLSKEPPERLN